MLKLNEQRISRATTNRSKESVSSSIVCNLQFLKICLGVQSTNNIRSTAVGMPTSVFTVESSDLQWKK